MFDDVAFINDPDEWPAWPRLPVKKQVEGQNWPEMAVIVPLSEGGLGLFEGNLFQSEPLPPEPIEKFKNGQAVFAAGWRVD